MGRGRQKAKQTKVARKLKYFSPSTDYSALQRELSGPNDPSAHTHHVADDEFDDEGDELDDEYADEDDDDEDDDWSPRR